MAQKLPGDVFTPKSIVSRDMFARRSEADLLGNPGLQDLLMDALAEKGAQIRVFGDTGVGKTSLVTFAAHDSKLKCLIVGCMSDHDYSDLIEIAIRKIQGVRLISFTKSVRQIVGAEASGGWHFIASAKGSYQRDGGKEKEFEIVAKQPLDLLLELMGAQGYRLLVLDNFHNIQHDKTRVQVAQTMETLSDHAEETGGIAIVVIGIAQDAKSLLGNSGSFRRRTTDIGVPRMPDEEIREIFTAGFKLLGLQVDSDTLDHLVFFSDGFPFFAHLLGLNIGRAARREEVRVVSPILMAKAMARAANEVDATYSERIHLAEESGGGVQPRRRILKLFAESREREWTSNAIKELWLTEFGGRSDKLGYINVALGQLIKEDMGRVLARKNDKKPFIYQFDDPHIRAFLRLRSLNEGI